MTAAPPFLGFPDRLADGRLPRAVIFGAGHGSTYPGRDSSAAHRYGSRFVTAREVHAEASKPLSGIFRKERGSSSPSTATASIRASCRAWRRVRPAVSPTRRRST